ncbi:MAG: TetR/AcrR family transcriptional regulator [Actinomycetota bacterium]|nr:TetR/AcrR family transcriptional regulator [Actinomycetota bacterium]
MTVVSDLGRLDQGTLTSSERIRDAALANFAVHGTAATSMRAVASAAGVSLGLVQHHFATKAGLIDAVDDYVLAVVLARMSEPVAAPPADSISDIGSRVTGIIAHHPEVASYVGRALVDGSPLGARLFDALMDVGLARWQLRADRGETRSDVDLTWATINGLVLALGAISLRAHVDRHLPESFTAPEQLRRWQHATDSLLREGLFRDGLRD